VICSHHCSIAWVLPGYLLLWSLFNLLLFLFLFDPFDLLLFVVVACWVPTFTIYIVVGVTVLTHIALLEDCW